MAIVHFVKSTRTQTVGGLNAVINYCCKDAKVNYEGRPLVSGVNCVPQCALQEFMNTKRLHQNTQGRMYYHMVQSFRPDDPVTPEQAHEIALKLADQIPGFEIVVATHTDRDHIHSHFVINSVSCDTGLKYHSNKDSLMKLWKASDELCLQYGLSVVKPKENKERAMSDREYRAYEKGQSWKMNLEIDIDQCMTLARDREHFIRLMECSGYEVKWTAERKNITYTTPAGYKCRDSKLNGTKYHKEVMEHEFRIRKEICRANAAGTERYDLAGGECAAHRDYHGAELERSDQFPEDAGQDYGRDSGEAGYLDHGRPVSGVHGTAASDPAGGWAGQRRSSGAVPEDPDAGSEEHCLDDAGCDEGYESTGWEDQRRIWQSHLAGAGTDAEYFEEAVLDLDDSQPDLGSLGTDAAYLAAGLMDLIDDRPVEDCTTKHFRPERKNHEGPTMGGM
jgi:hypothetical protein